MEKDFYTLIDKYLQGEVTDKEHEEFEDLLNSNPEFAEAYQMRQQMTDYLRAKQGQGALESKLAKLGKQYFKEEKPKQAKPVPMRFMRIGLGLAAAIALLLVLWNPFSSGDLYSEFASHPPLALVEKSGVEAIFQHAENAYAKAEYESAYMALVEVIAQTPENTQAQLALGISALETGRIEQAQIVFSDLANGSSSLKNYGQWYLALSYVKQGKNEQAQVILEQLSNTESDFKEKAKDLLSRL